MINHIIDPLNIKFLLYFTLRSSLDRYRYLTMIKFDLVSPSRWTGSNTNPNNNDGQGLPGTDRSNMVPLGQQVYGDESSAYYEPFVKFGHYGRSYPQEIMNSTFAGFNVQTMTNMAVLQPSKYWYCLIGNLMWWKIYKHSVVLLNELFGP